MVRLSDFRKYFIAGALFWVVVDFTTAFNPDVQDWINHMPLVWVFYLGSPLLFAYLIYNRKWSDRKLFLPLVAFTLALEVFVFNNSLLYTFPAMLVFLPAAICIYSFITYVPRWLVDGKLKEHWILTLALSAIWATIAILSYVTRAQG